MKTVRNLTGALLLALSPLAAANPSDTPTEVAFPAMTTATKAIADRYFDAYIRMDWDALEREAGESISFADPTAGPVFGSDVMQQGSGPVLAAFRQNYANLTMQFQPMRKVYSGEHAIYEGTLNWSTALPKRTIRTRMPFIVMLRVKGGKVIEHRDFADYQPFIDAEVASRPKPAAATASR